MAAAVAVANNVEMDSEGHMATLYPPTRPVYMARLHQETVSEPTSANCQLLLFNDASEPLVEITVGVFCEVGKRILCSICVEREIRGLRACLKEGYSSMQDTP